jgi:hypothetical protein
LPDDDWLTGMVDRDLRAFIQVTRFLLVRGQKPTGMILHTHDAATDGYPIDVHVHRREKHADLLPLSRWRRIARGGTCDHHTAVGRRKHRAWRSVVSTVGIAKEEQEKTGQNQQRDAEERPSEQPDEGSDDRRPEDERPTGRVDSHKWCPASAEPNQTSVRLHPNTSQTSVVSGFSRTQTA